MKVYITTDIEGVSGVSTWRQTGVEGRGSEYEEARHLLTGEVNAAVEGAMEAGAGEIVVLDGHMSGGNFIMADLHPGARYVSGPNSPIVAQALDASYDAVVLLGYHAMAGAPGAVLSHTQSSTQWFACHLNGRLVGEIGQFAFITGHYKVPIVCVTGDRAACEEARALLGVIETVAVKQGLGQHCAIMEAPAKARAMIREGVARALRRRGDCGPFAYETPIKVKLELKDPVFAERYVRLGWKRLDGRTVTKVAATALDIID